MAAIGSYYVFTVMRMSMPGIWIMLNVANQILVVNWARKLSISRSPNLKTYSKKKSRVFQYKSELSVPLRNENSTPNTKN